MNPSTGKKLSISSILIVSLMVVAIPAAQTLAGEFTTFNAARFLSSEWNSDYLGVGSGSGNTGPGFAPWSDTVSEEVMTPDKLLSFGATASQDSLIESTSYSATGSSSAFIAPKQPLAQQVIGTTSYGESAYQLEFMVTEEVAVQFECPSYSLSASEYGTAQFYAEVIDLSSARLVYGFYDSVTSGTSSGSVISSPFTLSPGEPYALAIINATEVTMNKVPEVVSLEQATSSATYSMNIVPEPASLISLMLGGLLVLRRRK